MPLTQRSCSTAWEEIRNTTSTHTPKGGRKEGMAAATGYYRLYGASNLPHSGGGHGGADQATGASVVVIAAASSSCCCCCASSCPSWCCVEARDTESSLLSAATASKVSCVTFCCPNTTDRSSITASRSRDTSTRRSASWSQDCPPPLCLSRAVGAIMLMRMYYWECDSLVCTQYRFVLVDIAPLHVL